MGINLIIINDETEKFLQIIDALNGLQSDFKFTINSLDLGFIFKNCKVSWEQFEEKIGKASDKNIYIMNNEFDDGWFSHNNDNIALISCKAYENIYNYSLNDYILYQISIALIRFVLNLSYKFIHFSHKESKGCMLDFCSYKPEIIFGMKAGFICGECKIILRNRRVKDSMIKSIEKILSYIRKSFIGDGIVNFKGAFIVMEFNDKNERLYNSSIKPALEEYKIESCRADKNTLSNFIYENVTNNIKQNNYIVVIASNNKNVYFELGYALALNKRVIVLKNSNDDNDIATDINSLIYVEFDNEYDLRSKLESKLKELI